MWVRKRKKAAKATHENILFICGNYKCFYGVTPLFSGPNVYDYTNAHRFARVPAYPGKDLVADPDQLAGVLRNTRYREFV